MSLAPVEAVSISRIGELESASGPTIESGPSFAQFLGSALSNVDHSLNAADSAARSMAAGHQMPVQDVMIAMEEAHLRLQFAVEVRNRIVDAYQNLTNMQL